MCLEIYEVNPTHFLSTPGLPLQAALWDKKILEEKCVTQFIDIQKLVPNTCNILIKKSSYFQYWNVRRLIKFKWVKELKN